MGTVQYSIEVKVPVHTAYDCLSHFEEYPRFMDDVEAVHRVDSMHLQWVTRMDNHPVEWDAEITEQETDRCIAWQNVSGPGNGGKLELQPTGDASSRVTFTWHLNADELPGRKATDPDHLMAQRLKEDMERMKDFIETTASNSSRSDPIAQAESEITPSHASQSNANPQKAGGMGGLVGELGGTEAAAAASLSGKKGGGPGGPSLRELIEPAGSPGTPGGMIEGDKVSPGADAYVAGDAGLGSAATADDTRAGTGTSSGAGTALTGGGTSGARRPGMGSHK